MQTITLPKKIEYQKGSEQNNGQVIIEPLFPGYGITLGNSLRRILLSSLPGASAIGVKIEGVNHEFMTLPYLREDILEFILNLKKLRLKIFVEDIVKLELEVHGAKEIKASDIKKNSNVEIANPELVIGHISDMAGSIKAEIFTSQGMGYEMIESREMHENEIGYIEMDSIFSPIAAVGMKVENVRVGKMTNWERLVLNITTDGTIDFENAFRQSVAILLEQYNALLGKVEPETKTETELSDNVQASEGENLISPEILVASADVKADEAPLEEGEAPKRKRGRPKKTN